MVRMLKGQRCAPAFFGGRGKKGKLRPLIDEWSDAIVAELPLPSV